MKSDVSLLVCRVFSPAFRCNSLVYAKGTDKVIKFDFRLDSVRHNSLSRIIIKDLE